MAAVRRYAVLDTPSDGTFDRITALAARLFHVPIAVVSIVDTDRIWFKSRHGLEVSEIGRDPGLCASAILQDGPYVVEDAAVDPRTLTNPLVAGEMGLRFYAAAPLTTSDGHNLGTVCVLDTKPREVTDEERQTLHDLAAVVIDELELRCAARELHEQEGRQLADTIRFARTLQESLIPAVLPDIAGIELAGDFRPADERQVSGDFYDVFRISDDRWGIALGDVAGKGPKAAAATSLVRYSLRTAALDAATPAHALNLANRTMLNSEYFGPRTKPGFCTLVLAYLTLGDPDPEIVIARAGHVRPLIVQNGAWRVSNASGPLLGVYPEVSFVLDRTLMRAGTSLLLYTDGVTEAKDGADRVGEDQLFAALAHSPSTEPSALIKQALTVIDQLTTEPNDDIALLAVGRQATPPRR